jgi:undecaprenyl pyrophosphate synthase
MTPELTTLASTILHWVVGTLLAFAVASFVWQFMLPGRRIGRDLAQARKQLEVLKANGPVLELDRLRNEVMVSDALRHAWDEYRDTLHGQKQANEMGMLEVTRWRATSMANGFFTDQALIEAPLRTEFYKHLPGILTGVGIIGTFSGLIIGLQGFKVTDDAEVVRRSLETLILSVGGAFVVSASAIALAILVTWIEKLTINRRYTELEALCGQIDSLFDTGAGEEYLQRLVEASETSATQTMQMKESLVTDLKQVLTELTQQQIATMTSTSTNLGQVISTSLTEGLAEPLTRISNAVQAVGSSQGEAVNKLLTDVLGGFTAQMDTMFGSQMRGMNEMLVQTANTIQTASLRFEQLAGQMEQAGAGAADAMAKRMDEALQQMQARQSEANDQMRLFIDQLKNNVANGQSESADMTMGMMKELSESTGALVKSLQDQAHNAQKAQSSQQNERDAQMQALMEQLKSSMAKNQGESADATVRLLGQLGDTTGSLIKSLRDQSHNAQQAQSAQQSERDVQMQELMEELKSSMAKSQGESADATVRLLGQLGDTTGSLIKGLQYQSHNAQQAQSAQQSERDAQMQALMEQLNSSMAKSQGESADATVRLLGKLGETTDNLLNVLQNQSYAAQQEHSKRQAELAAQTAELLNRQGEQVGRLGDAVQQASVAMREAIERIQTATNTNVERMGLGAERLLGASGKLSDNLGTMKAASDGLGTMAEKLNASAGTLSSALTATQQTLGDQKSVRDALALMVTDLRSTVENAKREASMTSELVNSLQEASHRLTEAQRSADTYLEGVTDVLGEAHGAFAKQMEVTLREGNRVFHQELAQATGLLKGAIQELGDVLENLPTSA